MSKTVVVIATSRGFDGVCIREIGEEFVVPAAMLEPRPKLDKDGKVIEGVFYDPPSWFKAKEERVQPQEQRGQGQANQQNRNQQNQRKQGEDLA